MLDQWWKEVETAGTHNVVSLLSFTPPSTIRNEATWCAKPLQWLQSSVGGGRSVDKIWYPKLSQVAVQCLSLTCHVTVYNDHSSRPIAIPPHPCIDRTVQRKRCYTHSIHLISWLWSMPGVAKIYDSREENCAKHDWTTSDHECLKTAISLQCQH